LYGWIRRPNVSYSMINCCKATTTANGRFLRKTAFYNEKFKISKGCKVGVKNFCTKLAHPYAKSGRTNRLAYVAVTLYVHMRYDQILSI